MSRPFFSAVPLISGIDHGIFGFAVDETDPRRVLAVGGQRVDLTLLSNDSGHTWQRLMSPGKGLRGGWIRGNEMMVAGEYGTLARSDDGGATWTSIDVGTAGCLFGVTRDDEGTFVVAGDGGFITTSTDGRRFKPLSGAKVSLSRVAKTSLGVLIPTDAPGDILLVTSQPKPKVTKLAIGTGADLMTVTMTPKGTLVAVGDKAQIHRSTDDGTTWTAATHAATGLLTGVCALPSGRVVCVGDKAVYVSDDDGVSFVAAQAPVSNGRLWCCVALADGSVLVGAEKGLLVRLQEAPATFVPGAPTGVRGLVPGVLVDDGLRAMVRGWRGGSIALPPPALPDVDTAWAALRAQMWSANQWRTTVRSFTKTLWALHTDSERHKRRLAARLTDEKAVVGSGDEDIALVRLAFSDDVQSAQSDEMFDALADFLVSSVGIVEAVRRAICGLEGRLPYVDVGVFGRLRDRLVVASDADYAAVLDLALPLLNAVNDNDDYRVIGVLSALAFLLPPGEEPHDVELELQRRAAARIGEFGDLAVAHPSLLASADTGVFQTFMKKHKETRHEFFAGDDRPYIATLLARGDRALIQHLPTMKPRYDTGTAMWAALLARVDSDLVLHTLQRGRAGDSLRPATDGLAIAARLDPERAGLWALRQRDHGGDKDDRVLELPAVLAVAASSAPLPPPPPSTSSGTAGLGTYTPPKRLSPTLLAVPEPLQLPTEFSWRDDEREAAENNTPHAPHWTFQSDSADKAVELPGASTADVDAYVALREQWSLPTPSELYVLLPLRLHARLAALGTVVGAPKWNCWHAALHRSPEHALPAFRQYVVDDASELDERLERALPIGDVWFVPAVVTAFAGKKNKPLARQWALRHPRHAAAGTLAMLRLDVDAADAARLLRFVDGLGHRDTILRFASGIDEAFVARVTTLLDEDPLSAPGVKLPTLPAYAKPATLPPLLDAAGTVLADADVEALLVRIASSNPDEVNPAIMRAKRTLSTTSLAAWSAALFDAWLAHGSDPKQTWCLYAVGFFGDDDVIRRLSTLVRAWPGESAAARAQQGLDTLVLHGGDAALLQLALIAEKSKFAALKKGAGERIGAIADRRSLTTDELADRLVPTFDLDDAATTALDFGVRRFSVGFDEALVPRVKDATGAVLKDLPKPNKTDDADLAKEAKKRLTALKKDVKTVADLLLRRLERGMVEGRRSDVASFVACFVEHPLTFHVSKRLLWEVVDAAGTRLGLFRIAEDRTFADADDTAFTLPTTSGTQVGVVHPLFIDDATLKTWSTVFADYELLQPFAQLGRAMHRLTDAERATTSLRRFAGKKLPAPTLVFGLEARGWRRWDIVDGGAFNTHFKVVGGVRAVIEYDGAVGMGFIEPTETLTLTDATFAQARGPALALADVDPRFLSEVLVDIDSLQ